MREFESYTGLLFTFTDAIGRRISLKMKIFLVQIQGERIFSSLIGKTPNSGFGL